MFLFWQLLQRLSKYLPKKQIDLIAQAYLFAADAHEQQARSSGEPYITHPVAVSCILADLHMDKETIMAALMHDLVEDTQVSAEDIAVLFGEKVAELVRGVTKLTKISFQSKEEAQAENFCKMMLAMVEDIRVIIIKLADRYHNMQTLGALRPDKRRRIARETLEIYAPIANRLGMNHFKTVFQDLGFQALYPMRYRVLKRRVQVAQGSRRKLFEKIKEVLAHTLQAYGVSPQNITGREKRTYSIYRKMRLRAITFSEIMDMYGYRVIARDLPDCYRLLGAVHSVFKPVPGRFKDYIAIPKANGYQSLHTTLFGPHGVPIEIQIRTAQMDRMAENGIAAHWLYKTSGFASATEVKTREWLRQLLDMQRQSGDSIEFIENVKIDLYPDEVYVFTPQGDIMELPKGATPVDFAYAVHTEIGNHCIAARVNRRLVPLSFVLSNGQTVEIKTDQQSLPNPAWLNFVVTGKAKGAIRHFLKSRREHEVQRLGARLLDFSLEQYELSWDTIKDAVKQAVYKELEVADEKQLLSEIGLGERSAPLVAQQIINAIDHVQTEMPLETQGLLIHGSEGMNLTFAQCCYPIPGDDVRGIIRKGSGIEVHCVDCAILQHESINLPENSVIPLRWADDIHGQFAVLLRVETLNQRGVLARIAEEVERIEVDIRGLDILEIQDQYGILLLKVMVAGRQQLARLMRGIRKLPFIMRIARQHTMRDNDNDRENNHPNY